MIEYSENKYYTIRPSYLNSNQEFDIQIDWGIPSLSHLTLLQTSILKLQQIYELVGPLNIFVSGGIDSHCLLEAAYKSKVPFTAITWRFTKDLNKKEVNLASDICSSIHCKHKIIDIDIIKFYIEKEFVKFYNHYKSTSPQISLHCHAISEFPNSIRAGQPPVLYNRDNIIASIKQFQNWQHYTHIIHKKQSNNPNSKYFSNLTIPSHCFFISADAQDGALMRFSDSHKSFIPNFFMYSQEQRNAALNAKTYDSILKNYSKWNHQSKINVYRENGFTLAKDTAEPLTGFEDVKLYLKKNYNVIFDKEYRDPYKTECVGSHSANLLDYKFITNYDYQRNNIF
jgi:hypothetical protein